MSKLYEAIFNTALSRLSPEFAHRSTLRLLQRVQNTPFGLSLLTHAFGKPVDKRLFQEIWALSFTNPLGVAAGLDKNAQAPLALGSLGFGHVEVGTITPKPQPGNPSPRVWRVPEQHALINALGFPSEGTLPIRQRLVGLQRRRKNFRRSPPVIGVNLGKNAQTPLEHAASDYQTLIRTLFSVADYFSVNISSPNTAGLRSIQDAHELEPFLRAIWAENNACAQKERLPARPLLLKLSPDLGDGAIESAAGHALDAGFCGLIATNTTTSREQLPQPYRSLPGGLSGPPLQKRATAVIRRLYRTTAGKLPIVGVGGVSSIRDCLNHIEAGASLVQLYTGLVYQGPALVSHILAGLSRDADNRGWRSISELIGTRA